MSHEPCQCYRPSSKIIGFVSGHAFRHAAQTRSSDIAPIRRSILGGSIGCGKSLNRDDSPPQGLKPSLVLHDLRGVKAPLYHSAAGFRDFFRSLLGGFWVRFIISSAGNFRELLSLFVPKTEQGMDVPMLMDLQDSRQGTILFC